MREFRVNYTVSGSGEFSIMAKDRASAEKRVRVLEETFQLTMRMEDDENVPGGDETFPDVDETVTVLGLVDREDESLEVQAWREERRTR